LKDNLKTVIPNSATGWKRYWLPEGTCAIFSR